MSWAIVSPEAAEAEPLKISITGQLVLALRPFEASRALSSVLVHLN